MTTLAAIQGDGWAVLGCDSKISGVGNYTFTPYPKIFKNGVAVIAACGSVRGLNLLEFGWTVPRYAGKSVEHYLTRTFIPSMRNVMIEAQVDMQEDKTVPDFGNGLLVAIKGRLFSVNDDYSWDCSEKGLYSYGSGASYSMGALVALKADKAKSVEQAQTLIIHAVNTAIACDIYTGGAIHTVAQHA